MASVIAVLIKKVMDLIEEEAVFLDEVGEKAKLLEAELERLQCFLQDAEDKKHKSPRILNLISQLTDAVCEAQETLENYLLNVKLKDKKGFLDYIRYAFIKLVNLDGVGKKIEEITVRLSQIKSSFTAYGVIESQFNGASTSSPQNRPPNERGSFHHVVEQNLIGLEQTVEELATKLVDNDRKYEVVSIWGMGGVGKTTLAKQIYKHHKGNDHFTHFAWACVSQQFQTRSQLEKIFFMFSPEENRERIKNLEVAELAEKIHTFMKDHKCLVVVDDIWKDEDWESLQIAFSCESGSKILLTSRNKDIASSVHVDRRFLHRLAPLPEEESWELFQKIAFSKENKSDELQKKELGTKMVRRCGGLPLAIKVLGGLLANKENISDWKKVHENIGLDPGGTKNSIVSKYNSKVSAVLSLSYDDLSSSLKPCFLYMGMFPEDYEIPIKKLIRYWIAEELVTGDDMGKSHIDELIERSMVLIGTMDETGLEMKTCRMHDLMKDICLCKAKEVKFLQVNKGNSIRLAVHLLEDNNLIEEKRNRNARLRSLIYLIPFDNYLGMEMKSFLYLIFLRVLDLENVKVKGELHKGIGKLIHLRYLSLRNSELTKLPSSLGNLKLMLTLDLRIALGKEMIVPNVIWKMKKLMHLYFPSNCIGERETQIELGDLRNLETLVNFEIGVMNIEDLFKMENLRKLSLNLSQPYDTMGHPILNKKMKNLQQLKFKWSKESDSTGGFMNQMVSVCTNLDRLKVLGNELILKNITFPETITCMILRDCSVEEGDPMSILEKLPNLRYLTMEDAKGSEIKCSTQGFPLLRYMVLRRLLELEYWRIEHGAMPNLLRLEIYDCNRLELPVGLPFITTLQELTIVESREDFNEDRFKEGAEDFPKVQHIPVLRFSNPSYAKFNRRLTGSTVEELAIKLVDNGKKYEIVSIWGSRGVGKTALAKQIYNHQIIKNHFTHFAWVWISHQRQTRSQLEKIFFMFSPEEDRERIINLGIREVAEKIHAFMKNNKCLVVIDDIQFNKDWESLQIAFPCESGSKILLTSRYKDVASYVHDDRRGFLYELEGLPEDESSHLFQIKAAVLASVTIKPAPSNQHRRSRSVDPTSSIKSIQQRRTSNQQRPPWRI